MSSNLFSMLDRISRGPELYTEQEHADALLQEGELVSEQAERAQRQLDNLTKQAALARTISARQWAKATGKSVTTTAKRFREYRQEEADAKAKLREQAIAAGHSIVDPNARR